MAVQWLKCCWHDHCILVASIHDACGAYIRVFQRFSTSDATSNLTRVGRHVCDKQVTEAFGKQRRPKEVAQELVNTARQAGSVDDVTAVVAKLW